MVRLFSGTRYPLGKPPLYVIAKLRQPGGHSVALALRSPPFASFLFEGQGFLSLLRLHSFLQLLRDLSGSIFP